MEALNFRLKKQILWTVRENNKNKKKIKKLKVKKETSQVPGN